MNSDEEMPKMADTTAPIYKTKKNLFGAEKSVACIIYKLPAEMSAVCGLTWVAW